MATIETRQYPYGIGRFSPLSLVALAGLLALIVLGLVAYSRQFIEGDVVTGLRDVGTMGGATWGLYIAFVIYFEGVAFAGIAIAAVIRLFDLEFLRPVGRMALVLTVVAVVLAGLSVLADLGQPVRAIENILRYARPESPFFGTFTLVIGGFLFASVIFLYLDGRRDAARLAKEPGGFRGFYRLWAAGYSDTVAEGERHQRTTFWLVLAIIPLLVAAHSTLGWVFGLQGGAAGWYGTLQAPAFLLLAGVSGIGHVIVIAAIARSALHLETQISDRVFSWLGNFLWVLVIAYLYFLVAEVLTTIYGGHHHEGIVTDAMLSGTYAWLFWLSVGLLIISFGLLFVQFTRSKYSILLTVLAGVMVNVAAVAARFLIVVPSQTHGRLLPYEAGTYSPTWVEYGVIAGLLAFGALAIILFFKVFPIMEVEPEDAGAGRLPEEANHA